MMKLLAVVLGPETMPGPLIVAPTGPSPFAEAGQAIVATTAPANAITARVRFIPRLRVLEVSTPTYSASSRSVPADRWRASQASGFRRVGGR